VLFMTRRSSKAAMPRTSSTGEAAAPGALLDLTHVRGCLLGGAVGDALGAAIEFDNLAKIRRRFGRTGLQD
jgi:hypothetical protein